MPEPTSASSASCPAATSTGGNFLRPAIVVDPDPSLRVVTQEQFGPVIPIIPFDTEDEAVAAANDTWAGLCGSVWTADVDAANRVGGKLACGYVWVNDHGATRLDLRAPFGGMKQSGHGPRAGHRGHPGVPGHPLDRPHRRRGPRGASALSPSIEAGATNTRRSSRLLLLVAVLLIAANLRATITGVGPLLTQIADDLGTSEAALGALAAVPLIAFAVVSPFAHGLSARFGMPRVVLWSLVLMAVGTVWRSLPGSAVNLWLGTALIGASIAIANVLMPAVIKRDFSERITVVTAAFTALLAGMGAVASGVVVPISHMQTSAGDLGWQGALLWTGALLPFAIVAWLLSIRSRPRDAGSSARRRRSGIWGDPDRVAGAAVHGPAVEHLLHARHLVRPDRALARPLGGRGGRRRHDLPAVRDRGFAHDPAAAARADAAHRTRGDPRALADRRAGPDRPARAHSCCG